MKVPVNHKPGKKQGKWETKTNVKGSVNRF